MPGTHPAFLFMDKNFKRALITVLANEGLLSNHPADHGGLTYKGITQRVYDRYRDKKQRPRQFVSKADDIEIEEIYYTDYWLVGKCQELDWPVSLAHFDACVHHGPKAAVEIMQASLDVPVDGYLGPVTKAELQKRGVWEACLLLVTARKGYALALTNVNTSQEVFLKGWLNRIKRLGAKLISFGD